ncbi:MAG: serine protein kinase RIO [Euryarchaeota archaeon]|nr:serine protein kinase RIO [Euryarchaeota archaeon]
MGLDEKMDRYEQRLNDLGIRIRDADDRKVWGSCLDDSTLEVLYSISSRGIVRAYGGPLRTGKEANVFHALGPGKEELAVKIYRVATSSFRQMEPYLAGDPRFGDHPRDRRAITTLWARKEFRNLTTAREVGVRVPEPREVEGNVLVMEFIGVDGEGAPSLKESEGELRAGDGVEVLRKVVEDVKRLYRRGNLVHADLSEYNILYFDVPVLIDFAQGVHRDHPMAREFLQRDIENLARFFQSLGVPADPADLLREVTA